jgi:hypothetical protein
MQLRHFVSGSAILLIAWLGVTFLHEVPTQRYLQPGSRKTTSANDKPSVAPALVDEVDSRNSELVEVSASR